MEDLARKRQHNTNITLLWLYIGIIWLAINVKPSSSATTPPPVPCTPPTVSDSTYLPNTASFNAGENVTYTCDTGFQLVGDTTLTCQADGSWIGNTPSCSIVTCTTDSIAYATKVPGTSPINYNTNVTYTCDTGYQLASGSATRTCQANSLLSGTDPVCAIITCTTDNIPNADKSPATAAINYDTNVTYSCQTGYVLASGDAIRTCQADRSITGTPITCNIISCNASDILNAAKTPATPTIDYNTSVTYSCDTGYELASGDLTRTCQINGNLSGSQPACSIIKCNTSDIQNAVKMPSSPTLDLNMTVSYSCDIGYELTSGDVYRTCQLDGNLIGTAPTCTIVACNASDISNAVKTPAMSSILFNNTVSYVCYYGYMLASGDGNRTCLSDGSLSGIQPTCIIITCNASDILNAAKTPATPTIDYNTTVTYSCDTGYELASGNLTRTCQIDGSLTGSALLCTVIKCNASDILNATKVPATPTIDYNSTVSYSCDIGYELASGDLTRTCQSDGNLSGTQPACTIIQCAAQVISFTSRSPLEAASDYNTSVTYACITGYNLTSGDLVRTCQLNKTWSGDDAVCTIVTCTEPANVALATKTPIHTSYNYSMSVTYVCDTGYRLDTGALVLTCTAAGTWDGAEPTCTNITCAAPPAVANSNMSPIADPYLYGQTITYTCDTGYELFSGNLVRTCVATDTFDGADPICTIKTCAYEAVANGTATPNTATYNYNTNVTYTCNLAWIHTAGDLTRTCNASAMWTGELPTCTVDACLPTPAVTNGYYSAVQTTYAFGYELNYFCNAGYYISSGDETRTCLTNGAWNNTQPVCSMVQCATPAAVSFSTHTPVQSLHNYGTNIVYTCDQAYNHTSGDLTRTCQQNFTFTGDPPVCTRVACIQEPSTYMTTNPDQTLHNFLTEIEYTCILGYNHSSGDLFRTCQPDGNWNGTKPECVIVTCDMPTAPPYSSIAPTAAFVNYNTFITYTCDLGYNRTGGDATRRCTETAAFEGIEANCTLVKCDPPTDIINGTYTPVLVEYDYNSTVNYTCNFGYYHADGDLTLRCDENAAWVVTDPVCMVVQCLSPIGPNMTLVPSHNMYDFNTTINATCDLGYNLTSGDAIRTCQETGSFDGTDANCTIVECDPPDPVAYSTMDLIKNPYVYADVIIYTCVTGYEITSGNSSRTCTETKAWTGTAPNCTIIHCPIPPTGGNNTYAPVWLDYVYLDNITYTCDYGYNFTGSLDSYCQADKTWSFDPAPVCHIVTCDVINVGNMSFTPASTTTIDFNTTITYQCDIGHNHTFGDLQRTCNASGEWTNTLPYCTIIECPAPEAVNYSSVVGTKTKYVYEDTLVYTCDTGYEMLTGNATRNCTETTDWTGTAPVCTIIHCPVPADGGNNTYAPVWLDYVYLDTVNYTCNTGYIHTTGSLYSVCQPDKTWSATPPPVCEIVKCNKVDFPYMTFTPYTATTHDFNTTITYTCDLGYNHTGGDVVRTCNESAHWNGNDPNCTLITCDPPAPIAHTFYVPNLVEHDWNTDIDYSCDPAYHYISGINKTTCNESGFFPPVDLDCSVQHTMSLNPAEPALTWFNSTNPTMNVIFDFDGICDVTILCNPPATFDITHVISGTSLTMTVTENAGTIFNEYYCSLTPFQGYRSFPLVNRTVFYGEEILGLQAWVDHPTKYIAVGQNYHYEANVTDGSNVTMIWVLDASTTQTYTFDGDFNYMDFYHTFTSPTENITVYANNLVTPNATAFIELYVIYVVNAATFTVNDNLRETSENAQFTLDFDASALIPMATVDISVSLLNGSGPFNYTETIQTSIPASFPYVYDCIYLVQGKYNVTAVITNPVSTVVLYQDMEIWDRLDTVDLTCHTNCSILVTNTLTVVEFTGVPVSGFKYSIDMGDGAVYQNASDLILYSPYALGNFSHTYTNPGYYHLQWNVWNGGRNNSGDFWITVQNRITNFQPWLNHTDIYVTIGESYLYKASADFGTNTTITWDFDTTKTDYYIGEFTYMEFNYTFTSPQTNVTVTASNLVNSVTTTIQLFAIYTLNGYTFVVDNTLKTTTENATFDIDFLGSTNIPLATVNGTIDFKKGSAATVFVNDMQHVIPGTLPQTYTVIYPVQGYYNVTLLLENPVDSVLLWKYMEIWDRLDTVVLTCHTNCSILVTNTLTVVEFSGVPVSGFQYSIDMGDGAIYQNVDDSILYSPYALGNFSHTYTNPGYYNLQWNVWNYGHNNSDNQWVTVQNLITNFQAWLNHGDIYIVIGTAYNFQASADMGTNVTINWDFATTQSDYFVGEFTSTSFMHTFTSPHTNVTVTASNLVNSASTTIQLFAIYTLNGYTFVVDNTLKTTTENATFDIDFLGSTNIPLATVNGTIDFKNGSAATVFVNDMQHVIPGTLPQTYTVIYPVQGYYNVTLLLENPVDSVLLWKYMEVWDRLDTVVLTCHTNCSILVTNTLTVVEFSGVPVSGFQYSIDMGDGAIYQIVDDSILYSPYALGNFSHTYTNPGYYNLQWNVWNYGHNNSDNQWVTVQNLITNFQAWLNHGDIYIVIGTAYNFQASADMGTNVTINWDFATTQSDYFVGEFTSTSFMHTFTSPHTNVTVTASNLVNSASTTIQLFAIYTLNGYTFDVDNTLKTTTENATFDIDFLGSTNIPLATVNGTIDFKNGSAATVFVNDMQHVIPGTLPQTYTVIYPVQGYYNVTLLLENPVDSVLLWKYMEVWDRLDTVVLTCHTNCSILVTNTLTVVEFSGVPVSGFQYSIDMGDGAIYQIVDDSILYSPYALGNFSHTYTNPGYYNLQWNVWNYGHNNSDNQWVTVQNLITNFQAWLNHGDIYIVIGTAYNFQASADMGTNVTINWDFATTQSDYFVGEFTSTSFMHTFTSPHTNVTVTASNLVNSVSTTIQLFAIYTLNGYTFDVDNTLKTTTENATFDIDFLGSTNIPLATVNGTIDFKNGSAATVFVNDMQHVIPGTLPQTYTVIYPVQGYYNVTLLLENPVDSVLLWKYMEVWDRLDTVVLTCHTNCSILVTNTLTVVEFSGVPVSGFQYSIDMGDGAIYQFVDDSILYSPYALGNFSHTYSSPGYYNLQWNVWNYGHNNSGSLWVTVQNVITDFQAWLDYHQIYLNIGDPYTFAANATQGTNVTLTWEMDTTVVQYYPGEFTSTSFSHTFTSSKWNATVTASNLVSSASTIIPLIAVYSLNGYLFEPDSFLVGTTENATFTLDFAGSANIPLANVEGALIFYDGGSVTTFVHDLHYVIPTTLPQTFSYLYLTQGYYTVTLNLTNPVSAVTVTKDMKVWDDLNPVQLVCKSNCPILVTNTYAEVEFANASRSGFEYLIDMNTVNGTFTSYGPDIYYHLYNLTSFSSQYTMPGIYFVDWSIENLEYTGLNGRLRLTVQNLITDFQAFSLHSSMYMEVGQRYSFAASGTGGTNVTIEWLMEDTNTETEFFDKEFSSAERRNYRFTSPKTNVTVIAWNLVSNFTKVLEIEVFYSVNNMLFKVVDPLGNTTSPKQFFFKLARKVEVPMHLVNVTIDFSHGNSTFDTLLIDSTAVRYTTYYYSHLFNMQGEFTVNARAENVFGFDTFSLTVNIWDSLLPLDFIFINAIKEKYIITNTVGQFQFINTPNFGFEYSIDFGDGTALVQNADDSILYAQYALSIFNHTYTSAGVYVLTWTAHNGEASYDREEKFLVHVQNRVPFTNYSVEPFQKKYPWINLQSQSISVNVTLDPSQLAPTNATCTFDADDGTPIVEDLEYDNAFMEYEHDYLVEGYFYTTLNCSNDVSNYLYNFEVEVRKVLASDISLVFHNYVPLNVSDSTTVYFHIDNNGFALIPLEINLTFDFGDGSTSGVLPYNETTYDHLYFERGNYTVTLYTDATVSNTSLATNYSLRLGLMYFEYNTTVQFINVTLQNYHMYGILGSASYTIEFDDGTTDETCTGANRAPCDIYHYCPQWGYQYVKVYGTNGSFIEHDNVTIICDNPIKNLTVGDATNVTIPNGTIDAKLILAPGDLFLPNLTCYWNMGDPIKIKTFGPISQRVTHWKPFNFTFQYIALGRHTITIDCHNLINSTRIETKIVVTNENFIFLGVFDRFYSQPHSPLPISSMHDVELFSRMNIQVNYLLKTHFNLWKPGVNVLEAIPNRHNLELTRGLLDSSIHQMVLEICFVEEPTNCIFEPTFIQSIMPPPHAEIVGGHRRLVNRGSVKVDAYTLSYDPAHPDDDSLTFSFTCYKYNAKTNDKFADAVQQYLDGALTKTCGIIVNSPGIESFDTTTNPQTSHYIIEVVVKNSLYNGSSSFIQVLEINNDDPLTLECRINCLSKVAVSSKLQLVSSMPDHCSVTFSWTLHEFGTNEYDIPITLGNSITEEGGSGRSLTILPHTFKPGTWYLISLTVTKGGKTYGPAYHEFLTNRPPKEGRCRIVQHDATSFFELSKELKNTTAFPGEVVELAAATELYNCTCTEWEDEGFTDNNFTLNQPLFYTFYVAYSSTVPSRRQVVYFDPGATSNLVSFQAGEEADNYTATVVIRVTDVFGDYTEVNYDIRAVPELLFSDLETMGNDEQFSAVRDYFSQFNEELIKANRTWDYRTISRRIMDLTSVYNKFNMNSSDGVILSPEDLLSLGYQKTENNEDMTWSDYWRLIVEAVDTRSSDYLASLGEDYANMLLAAVSTWPETKRMTLIAIDVIGRALNASLTKPELTNVTEAIYSSKICGIMSDHLKNISNDRTFPNTEHLEEVIQTLSDLIRNILSSLSAVLTPNFPQDPTVEEMRKYLEDIEIFRTSDGLAPLSLQEQTFLAQKQLQKYFVQKYIKEQASQVALSDVTKTLHILSYILGRLSYIEHTERFVENDFFYISVEIQPAYKFIGSTVDRPRVGLDLKNLTETSPMSCTSSRVEIRSIVFKSNPYFWGQFGDRITSYVPIFDIEGAKINSNQLQFRLENKVEPTCIDRQPTYDADDPNKMIYILFHRQHPEDDMLIFLRPNASELVYKLYFNRDEKPDITEGKYTYTTTMNKNDASWTVGDGYKLLIKSTEFSELGKIWIGLQPLLDNSQDWSLTTRNFCANVTSVNCLAWMKQDNNQYMWVKDHCQVSRSSTLTETVCTCPNNVNISDVIVGTTFYVPFNIVDFKTLEYTYFIYGRAPVIALLIAVASVYLLLVSWAWREDIKDQYKWSYSLLQDNDIADTYFYIMRVYTGLRAGSGTSSKIGFILVGDNCDTDVRMMDDDSHIGFESGSVRTFVMSTRRHLGDLICVRIWHDDSGQLNSSWYLNKITVQDMKSGKQYSFPADSWLDYDTGDNKVDRVLNAQPYKNVHSCQEMTAYTVAEHHLWLSIVLRPLKSNFTRVQRLSCLLAMIYITMIILTMIIRTSDEIPDDAAGIAAVVIGPFRFSLEHTISAAIAVLGATCAIMVVSFFFRNSENAEGYPNLDSMLRRAYRTVNDKLHFDKTVVGRRYWSPAEDAIEYTHFYLPHYCVYIGWLLLAISVALPTYFVCTMSVNWALIKSEEWMTSMCVSIMISFIVVEGVKVIILLIVFSICLRRCYKKPDPKIHEEELEEITRYNSATLNIGPNHEDILDKPKIPDEDTLLKNKIKRIQNHQLMQIFVQLLFFSGILYIVYTISYETRDPRSFFLKNHVEQKLDFNQVTDLQSYTQWLETTFIDTYFQKTYFGATYANHDMKLYMEDLANVRVGPARLRQLRVKPEQCVGPLKDIFNVCHDSYDEKRKETSDYCLRWYAQPCPVAQKSEFFSSDAWLYVSADEVWGFPTVATYATYGGGGYFMKLDVNRDVCGIIFSELVKASWFDAQTRAVILEFTLYNANTNLFIYSKFVAEFPQVGGFIPFTDIQVFRLYPTPDSENFILFLQFVFLLVVLVATLHVVYNLATDARSFLKVFWNILDIVALIMSYTTISIFIYKIFVIRKTIETFQDDKNAYVGFENLAFYDFVANTAYGVLVFLLSIRVSRILGYSGKINEMAAVISHAASDLYGFLLIFGITYMSYVLFGTLLFGKDTEKYKDLFQTYGTLTEAVIGKNRVANILTAKPGWAEFFYFTFVLFVLMTLATMAAAILNFSISVVKLEQKEMSPTNIVEIIYERIANFFRKLTQKDNSGNDSKGRQRKDSDAELKEILKDLSNFMKGVTSQNKSSDKYKLTDNSDQPIP